VKATDFGVISTTMAQRDDAERIAALLLSEKLAACVQIMAIDSRYVWKGKTAHEAEFLLLIKTRSALFDTVTARIAAIHPYETPEIVATPFAAGLPAYFAWIMENTNPA
jgi:periplasmic divalent cation tolerance protein